ncbi:MAG TPA: putative lipid II flippase FtsW [Candidatus Babeliales bacterium]|nr:putative lipid II flippase FtsW [Candidatus Babeliales bacterium]
MKFGTQNIQKLQYKNKIEHNLRIFILISIILIASGLIFIYSSSSVLALAQHGTSNYFVKKQLLGVILGLFTILIINSIPLEYIKKYTPLFFLSSLLLTTLTLLKKTSMTIHGSSRWLSVLGISIQPGELLKISFVLYVSYLLIKKKEYLKTFRNGYLPFLLILGLTSLILLAQPDFGLTITLTITTLIMLFLAEFNTIHLLLSIGAFIPIVALLIYAKPYRWKRILTFLNPWNDPQGAGFQIIQSLIAVGSGHIWGIGIAHSKQKFFYLPMQHTDFIFSIIAEETGFIGSSMIIILYMLFLVYGLRIALQLENRFCAYAVAGFVFMTSLQAAINILVVTGLLPTKGLGLPFISYGLSSLVCNMLMLGIIINMSRNNY